MLKGPIIQSLGFSGVATHLQLFASFLAMHITEQPDKNIAATIDNSISFMPFDRYSFFNNHSLPTKTASSEVLLNKSTAISGYPAKGNPARFKLVFNNTGQSVIS